MMPHLLGKVKPLVGRLPSPTLDSISITGRAPSPIVVVTYLLGKALPLMGKAPTLLNEAPLLKRMLDRFEGIRLPFLGKTRSLLNGEDVTLVGT
jgi:hypothetical protein